MDRRGLNRSVVAGLAWQGASKVIVQTASWVGTVVVARVLHPEDYGVMAVASVFIWVMTVVMEMGMTPGLVHKSTTTRAEEDGVFYVSIAVSLILYLLLYVTAPAIAAFYEMPGLVTVLRVVALGPLLGSLKAVPLALALRALDFRYRSLVEMAASFASTVVVVSLALAGFGIWSLVAGVVAQNAVTAIGYFPYLRRFPRLDFRWDDLRELFAFGAHITGANLSYVVSSRADIFVIGKMLGERFTGYYSMAFQLASMPLDKIGTVFSHIAFPALSRSREDLEQSRQLFLKMHRVLLVIGYPILLGLAVSANELVVVLLTAKWLPIVPVLQVLCVVSAVRLSGMHLVPLLNSRGRVRETLAYSSAGIIVLPVSFIIGATFGLLGVAYAWLVAYPLLYAMLLRWALQELGITFRAFVAALSSPILATAAMLLVMVAVRDISGESLPLVRLLLTAVAGAAVYAATFILFFNHEIGQMKRAVMMLRRDA